MERLVVDTNTLLELSSKVKENNNKLLNIVSNIKDMTIDYDDMLISDAGKLYKETMIKEQDKERERILNNDQLIAEKLSSFADIYNDTCSKIKGMM